jgi:flagellin-like protein
MKVRLIKKAVTPIIAIVMLLLITLSLAGMAMVIFNQLGKQSQAQIKQQMTKMNIKGDLKEARALPNNNSFNFTAVNLFARKLPVDGKNTEFEISVAGVEYPCKVDSSCNADSIPEGYSCCCRNVDNKESEITGAGMTPNVDYKFTCYYKENFNVYTDYQVVWIYKEDGRELDREPIIVG